MTDEERIPCYRCGNLHHEDELKLFGYLCDSCFADVKELVESYMAQSPTNRGTLMCKFQDDDVVLYRAMYNPNDGVEIKEIARNLQRNLVPINAWAIRMPQGTSYLLVVGTNRNEIVPLTMAHIDPQVPTTNLKRIVFEETDQQKAMGRTLSKFIMGKPCENKLEMTIHEVGEITHYAADLIKAGLSPIDVIEKVLTKFCVADSTTRKYALIGSICSSAPEIVANAEDAGLIPQEDDAL